MPGEVLLAVRHSGQLVLSHFELALQLYGLALAGPGKFGDVDACDPVDGLDGLVELAQIDHPGELDVLEGEQPANRAPDLLYHLLHRVVGLHGHLSGHEDRYVFDVLNIDPRANRSLVLELVDKVGPEHVADLPTPLRSDEQRHRVPCRGLRTDLADTAEPLRE